MECQEPIADVGGFISRYAARMMGCGVHTSRVVRCAGRIAESYGYRAEISIMQRSIALTLKDPEKQLRYSEVAAVPSLPIRFSHNASLSALSWRAFDEHLPLSVLEGEYARILDTAPMSPLLMLLLASCANASFCRLFGGDWPSMGIVFSATFIGLFVRRELQARRMNHYFVWIAASFIASLCASVSLLFDITSETALATSVLFLVPGVPLINGVIDVVEGYVLSGFARLVEAALLIVSIAVGMSFTLVLVKDVLL